MVTAERSSRGKKNARGRVPKLESEGGGQEGGLGGRENREMERLGRRPDSLLEPTYPISGVGLTDLQAAATAPLQVLPCVPPPFPRLRHRPL